MADHRDGGLGREAIELFGPACFTFEDAGHGRFRFIAVVGWLDFRYGVREGKPLVAFSWDGQDERDRASGRGWAVRDGEAIMGRIFLHCGDDSSFRAVRDDDLTASRRRRGRR
ncbi:MAG: hypothetical protein ACC662_12240 [Planctomycetota bacterium]